MHSAATGYLRVSTREQGRSGLGLAAQRHDIEAFGAREGFSVNSWHRDVQTGGDPMRCCYVLGSPLLLRRPEQHVARSLSQGSIASRGMCTSLLD